MVQPQYQHRIPFDQVNIRTYTIDPVTEKPSVYFIHCGISGGLITYLYCALSRCRLNIRRFQLNLKKPKTAFTLVMMFPAGGMAYSQLTRKRYRMPSLPCQFFLNVQNAIDYFIDPLVGFYSDGPILRRLEIYHDPLIPRVCKPAKISFPYLTQLGIVPENEIAIPHSILLIPLSAILDLFACESFCKSLEYGSKCHISPPVACLSPICPAWPDYFSH